MSPTRHGIPPLFDGAWDSAIVCTYHADLAFYERDLWRQIQRVRNRVVFADGRQVARRFAVAENRAPLRQVNRTYILAPIAGAHAAHAKLILLLAEDRGRLAVGSGNLDMTGYASQGECFTTYHWSPDAPAHLSAFVDAKDFVDRIVRLDSVDEIVRARILQAWQNAPWVYAASPSSALRHNLIRPLLDQFAEAIGDRPVDELVVHAPFYDYRCRALAQLVARTRPARLILLLQERMTSVDPERLATVLREANGELDVRSVQAEEQGTFLHAKFLIARCSDTAVCLQGSPNLSAPALLEAHPHGNIELANLLVGHREAFDHLVNDLVVSNESRDIGDLGLALAEDDEADDTGVATRAVRELVWRRPRLTGTFAGTVTTPPALTIGELPVADVTWTLDEPDQGTTTFTATLGDDASALLTNVEAVTFIFDTGEVSTPAFPYHLDQLLALASGQERTDLLRHAGDFDIDDEELEHLLLQLEETLVIDGHSLWRMAKRTPPDAPADDETPTLAYEDLPWDAIQAHPKLAQYRTWTNLSTTNPTSLSVLLDSIAGRFRDEVKRRRHGASFDASADSNSRADEDPFASPEPEDEDTAEAEDAAVDHRRQDARNQARRQFHRFLRRFAQGIADDEFVRLVGPSVIVPSYVVFSHICRKLAQLQLADPLEVIDAQVQLWRFFWGSDDAPGYVDTLGEAEQEAVLEVLDRHHAEAVLLCSIFQAYNDAWNHGDEPDLVATRDAWRIILRHQLWQPTRAAVTDAATVLEPACQSARDLVDELDGLVHLVTADEPRQVIARVLEATSSSVHTRGERVTRDGNLVDDVTVWVVDDPASAFDPDRAVRVIGELRGLLNDDRKRDYIRIHHLPTHAIAFADYVTSAFVYADRARDITELERPEPPPSPWQPGMDALTRLAS